MLPEDLPFSQATEEEQLRPIQQNWTFNTFT